MSRRSTSQVMAWREAVICDIEPRRETEVSDRVGDGVQCLPCYWYVPARRCEKSKAWLGKKTDSEVNGPLFEELAYELHHPNRKCVDYFKDG